VIAPDEKVSRPRVVLPPVHITENPCHERLLSMARAEHRSRPPSSILAARPRSRLPSKAAEAGFIDPAGRPGSQDPAAAEEAGCDIRRARLIPADSHARRSQSGPGGAAGTAAS
jgi:hypothetical protein